MGFEGSNEMSTPKSVQPAQNAVPEEALSMEPPASLDEAIQTAIGRKLRESWEEVVNEKVPDKFRDLLDQLKKTETSGQGNGGRES
jgi:hypothetical protein